MQLSYNKLQTFGECALKYRFAYIERLPRPPIAALAFHRRLHAALEKYHFFARRDGSGSRCSFFCKMKNRMKISVLSSGDWEAFRRRPVLSDSSDQQRETMQKVADELRVKSGKG